MKDVSPCQIDARKFRVEGEHNMNTYENLEVIVE
jgi:hypothetical protein